MSIISLVTRTHVSTRPPNKRYAWSLADRWPPRALCNTALPVSVCVSPMSSLRRRQSSSAKSSGSRLSPGGSIGLRRSRWLGAGAAVFRCLQLSSSVAPILFPHFFLVAAPLKWSSQKRVPFFPRDTEQLSQKPAPRSHPGRS